MGRTAQSQVANPFKNRAGFRETCGAVLDKFCPLDKIMAKIGSDSPGLDGKECISEIAHVIHLSSTDVRLHPMLQAQCSHEIGKYCSHLKPGNSRILICLKAEHESSEGEGFSGPCSKAIQRVILPSTMIEIYKKHALSAGITSKALDMLGLMKEGEVSFLTLRGPIALLALLSLILTTLASFYVCYRLNRKEDTSVPLDDDLPEDRRRAID